MRPSFYHKIPLTSGTNPFTLRPYRYFVVQKNIVDKLVKDMLEQGIKKYTNSPFASLTMLVN